MYALIWDATISPLNMVLNCRKVELGVIYPRLGNIRYPPSIGLIRFEIEPQNPLMVEEF
jgi:hypothetical protein